MPRKYLGAFGIESFVTLDPYVDGAARGEARVEAARILEHEPTLAGVRDLAFHGAPIGRNVLATVSRARVMLGINQRFVRRLFGVSYRHGCKRWQFWKNGCWHVVFLLKMRVVSPVTAVQFERVQLAVKANNLLVFEVGDVLAGKKRYCPL